MAEPFLPVDAATVNIDVSSSNQRVSLGRGSGPVHQLRIMNNGTATVWVSFGDVTIAAALATSFPVGAGVTEVMSFPKTGGLEKYVAAIAAGSTGKIYFTPGNGF